MPRGVRGAAAAARPTDREVRPRRRHFNADLPTYAPVERMEGLLGRVVRVEPLGSSRADKPTDGVLIAVTATEIFVRVEEKYRVDVIAFPRTGAYRCVRAGFAKVAADDAPAPSVPVSTPAASAAPKAATVTAPAVVTAPVEKKAETVPDEDEAPAAPSVDLDDDEDQPVATPSVMDDDDDVMAAEEPAADFDPTDED